MAKITQQIRKVLERLNMTKLTQQEIEQERVKFEEWFDSNYVLPYVNSVNGHWDENCNSYNISIAQLAYQAWLARDKLDKAGIK